MKSCQHCSKPIEGRRSSAIYCSNKCKIDAHTLKKANELSGLSTTPPMQFGNQGTIDPATQFIIGELTRDRDKLERLLAAETVKRENAEAANIQLEKDLANTMKDWDIEKIKGEKPSGLNGLMSSLSPEMLQMATPLLGQLMALLKPKESAPTPQLNGADVSPITAGIVEFMNELSKEAQTEFYNKILVPLSQIDTSNGEVELIHVINQLSLKAA